MTVQSDAAEPLYIVVVNDEEQYAIWLKDKAIPAGWRPEGGEGSRQECLHHIETVWTDMRPLSLRQQMTGTP